MIQHKLDDSGFTLIEVMVAIMVLVIGLLGAGMMQLNSITRNSESFNMTEATNLALNQIEQILSWDFNDVRLTDTTGTPHVAGQGVAYQRNGILGVITPANNVIGPVNDAADAAIQTDGNYMIYYDVAPTMDPGDPLTQVGMDLQVHVVWSEGSRLKTVSMSSNKTL